VLAELAQLNREYEARHGFRFVVFVDGRPKREILQALRARLPRSREEELETALGELVAIARDRWRRARRDGPGGTGVVGEPWVSPQRRRG
jgi:2-oxo-4-hydroxy-4-carboxy--5-ureidoimidazoline (OHCU) decarboxylase